MLQLLDITFACPMTDMPFLSQMKFKLSIKILLSDSSKPWCLVTARQNFPILLLGIRFTQNSFDCSIPWFFLFVPIFNPFSRCFSLLGFELPFFNSKFDRQSFDLNKELPFFIIIPSPMVYYAEEKLNNGKRAKEINKKNDKK